MWRSSAADGCVNKLGAVNLHPEVATLAPLLGTWSGEGQGSYPTTKDFVYRETVTFSHVGKPNLAYAQRTWALDDGRPLHSEVGFWRVPVPGRLEVVLAHPTGVVEVETGTIQLGQLSRIELATIRVVCAPSAKSVVALERTFVLDGDVLRYTLRMAAVGIPLTHHLRAELRRE